MSPASKLRRAQPPAAGPTAASPARQRRLRREYARRLLGPAIAVAVVALVEAISWTPVKLTASAPILILAVVCATFVGGLVDGLVGAAHHGGRIWCEGSPEGAAFYFTLGEASGSPPASA